MVPPILYQRGVQNIIMQMSGWGGCTGNEMVHAGSAGSRRQPRAWSGVPGTKTAPLVLSPSEGDKQLNIEKDPFSIHIPHPSTFLLIRALHRIH